MAMVIFSKSVTSLNNQIAALFESKYSMTQKDFPNVFKFFESSLCKATCNQNSDKSVNGANMTHAVSLKQRLSFFDKAVKEVLTKNKNTSGVPLIEYVDPSTDFNANLFSIIRKKLSFYTNDEDIYDIAISAFSELMLKNFKKAFSEFDGTLTNGAKVKFEPYFHTLLNREIINQSKKFSEHHKHHQDVTPFEDETTEDALDREYNKRVKQLDQTDKKLLDQLIKALNKKFRSEKAYDRIENILRLKLLGYNNTEIGKEIGISSVRVADFIWVIKDAIVELAGDLDKQGDSDLVELLTRYK